MAKRKYTFVKAENIEEFIHAGYLIRQICPGWTVLPTDKDPVQFAEETMWLPRESPLTYIIEWTEEDIGWGYGNTPDDFWDYNIGQNHEWFTPEEFKAAYSIDWP